MENKKKIQAIKTDRNISYVEARKLIPPQLSQTYSQAAKPSTVSTTTQTDENITKIVCQPLKLLQPLVSIPKPIMISKIPVVNKSSTTTQANILPSTSYVTVTSSSESQSSIPLIDTTPIISNSVSSSNKALSSSNLSMFTPLPAETCCAAETETSITYTIPSTSQDAKQTSKSLKERCPKRSITSKIDIQLTPHKPLQDTSDEDMLMYDVRNGHIKRITDNDIQSLVLEIVGNNVSTAYITCPADPRKTLGIKLPFLVLIVKNLKKYFTFEVQVVDDKNVRRRFRASNYQSTTRVKPFICTMPLRLDDGWNQIQFNLADFTRRAYGTNYVETLRVQIHANCRVRRVYFSDRLYSEDELPAEFKLYIPAHTRVKASA
ncbi:cilia- and flagella-associated protein 20 [Trichonephila clavipes]|nr:cilia- and flagella-associated protein 20 [Trichonephila clavipes]